MSKFSMKKNFEQGDLKKYLRTITYIPIVVSAYLLIDLLWGLATIESNGTIWGQILGFILFSILFSAFVVFMYTMFSPSFWGWVNHKLKDKRRH